ncbi:MAG: tryptophan 7-halogenase [Alphaproteobacteria bacterium]|nr:tryptophan 7-halogenase [Alphaproteobacteria bacterium]
MIKDIVIVGGGAAGWLTAGLIAARYRDNGQSPITVTLVESPNIPTIGVGEGTWPTMVGTLKRLGISEIEFIQKCNATLKQASKFQRWITGAADDHYYHPFTPPQGFEQLNLVETWQKDTSGHSFAHAASLQAHLCDQKRAPKQISTPEYSTVENHGYHLDAAKFTTMLTKHCTNKLGVRHILADVATVNAKERGDIASVSTKQAGDVMGDLFVDCTGSAALLIDKHYKVPFISKRDVLFIDRALAAQVPYPSEDAPIESATLSTAQSAGWVWDIGLQTRRGIGHVFSSAHTNRDAAARELEAYIAGVVPGYKGQDFREIRFDPGFREKFWVNNCVAVGMSAGFLEPLEASALVMIELAANMLSLHMPPHRDGMDTVSKRYNELFTFRWNRIIDFLKLHYVLSKRTDSEFWLDNRAAASIPNSLQEQLDLWRYQAPSNNGFLSPYDLFPAASYQYILYGMGFRTAPNHLTETRKAEQIAADALAQVADRVRNVPGKLPTNRDYIIAVQGMDTESELDLARTASSTVVPVADQEIGTLAQSYPLFFLTHPETGTLQCIALTGLARDEQLLASPTAKASAAPEASRIGATLQSQGLLEPVSLDILLDNGQPMKIKGLQVINRSALSSAPKAIQAALQKKGLQGAIVGLLNSLKQVETLIRKKNQLLDDVA